MQLMQSNNPQLLQLIAQPENLPFLYEALGLTDLVIPGEESRNKQYDEIRQLLNAEPYVVPPTEEETLVAISMGEEEPQPHEEPSVEVDEEFDNHAVELAICVSWINGEAGRQAKTENPEGYKNVLLHARLHKFFLNQQQMQATASAPGEEGDNTPNPNPKKDLKAPVKGEGDVRTQV
jgi:hypothetical protein